MFWDDALEIFATDVDDDESGGGGVVVLLIHKRLPVLRLNTTAGDAGHTLFTSMFLNDKYDDDDDDEGGTLNPPTHATNKALLNIRT